MEFYSGMVRGPSSLGGATAWRARPPGSWQPGPGCPRRGPGHAGYSAPGPAEGSVLDSSIENLEVPGPGGASGSSARPILEEGLAEDHGALHDVLQLRTLPPGVLLQHGERLIGRDRLLTSMENLEREMHGQPLMSPERSRSAGTLRWIPEAEEQVLPQPAFLHEPLGLLLRGGQTRDVHLDLALEPAASGADPPGSSAAWPGPPVSGPRSRPGTGCSRGRSPGIRAGRRRPP